MLDGFMVLLGIIVVGIFLFALHEEHGPGREEDE
jgi:hypothetical protein